MAAPAPASSDLVEPVTPTAWAGPAAAPAPASAIPSSPETRAADTEVEAFELPPEIEPSPEALPTGAAAPAASEPGREVASRSDAFAISAQPPSQPPPPPRQRRLRRPTKDHLSDHSTKDVPVAEASRTEWEQSRLEFLADGGACLPDGTPIATWMLKQHSLRKALTKADLGEALEEYEREMFRGASEVAIRNATLSAKLAEEAALKEIEAAKAKKQEVIDRISAAHDAHVLLRSSSSVTDEEKKMRRTSSAWGAELEGEASVHARDGKVKPKGRRGSVLMQALGASMHAGLISDSPAKVAPE